MSTNPKQFKCPLCPVVTATESALKCHAVSHTKEKPFKCSQCDTSFSRTSSNLNVHLQRYHYSTPAELEAFKKYKCTTCNYSTENKTDFNVHLRMHRGKNLLTCPEDGCGKVFSRHWGLKLHLRVHEDERPFKCEFPGCNYRARVQHVLTDHYAVHDIERPFKCPLDECNYSAKTRNALRKHAKKHGEPTYACPYPGCDYKARYRVHLRNHEATHSDSRPFKCTFTGCPYSGKTNAQLFNHNRIHTMGVRPHACKFPGCDRRFLRRWELTGHERSHTEEPYRCSFTDCDYKAWKKNDFKTHQATHNQRTVRCTVSGCKYMTTNERSLKKHIKSHEISSYASCVVSGCSFRSQYPHLLEKHMGVHESKHKKYSCPLCPRFYKEKVELEKHIRTHTGEKPFKCLECNFRSTNAYTVIGHMKRRYGRIISTESYLQQCQNKRAKETNRVRQQGFNNQSAHSEDRQKASALRKVCFVNLTRITLVQ